MRWLKRTISILMLLAAAGIALAIGFSNHSDEYGQVSLPQGGTVHLPKGKVTVFDRVQGQGSEIEPGAANLAFAVVPVEGGPPIAMSLANGETSGTSVTRRVTIGELGAFVKLDVPEAGDYRVTGSTSLAPGTFYLEFGTNAGAALLDRWKLLAGLVLGALLIAFIPVPRSRRGRGHEDEPHWSSDPRAPYAGWEPAHPAAAPARRSGDRRR
jgi:hypothetical protein